MNDTHSGVSGRELALARAVAEAPFLRTAAEAFPALADRFVADGSEAALAAALAVGEGDPLATRRSN